MPRAYFDDFEPGQEWGSHDWTATSEICARWSSAFGTPSSDRMPPALAFVALSQCVQDLLHEKPPGGVHVRQEIEFQGQANVGDKLTTFLSVNTKYLKRERRYVEFRTVTRNAAGDVIFTGLRTTIWAA
jgi:acyl dehydratase